MQKILYHYTSVDSLISIVKNGSFQITHSSFMNDPSELQYAQNNAYDICNKEKVDQNIKDAFLGFIDAVYNYENIFILSFSSEKDNLNLWYRYAYDNGINIGFDSADLNTMFRNNTGAFYYGLYKLIYELNEQESAIHDMLQELEIRNSISPVNIKNLTVSEKIKIVSLIFSIKNASYKEEQEYRYVFSIDKNSKNKPIQYRISNGIITPFYEVHFSVGEYIKEIHSSPRNCTSLAIEGINHFMANKCPKAIFSPSIISNR